jgi:DNA-binding GntR family transcriptional regulator
MPPEPLCMYSTQTNSEIGHHELGASNGMERKRTIAGQNADGTRSVYLRLKSLVLNCRFKPDHQLYPSELADHLRVSSTPVREALHRLAAEQLIIATQNRGFFSKTLCVEEVLELYRLTNALTRYAIECAPKSVGSQLIAIQDWQKLFHRENAVEASPALLSLALERLREQIALASSSHALAGIVGNLNDRTHFIRVLDLEGLSRRQEILGRAATLVDQLSHGRIAEALANLEIGLNRKLEIVPSLVKEGLMRCYESGVVYSDVNGRSET